MFAVIKTGGKQYRIKKGDVLDVEKLSVQKDKDIVFDEVLLVDDEKNTWIGTPYVENVQVKAVVIDNFKDDKVIVFKKKRRKQYRKTRGHRQELTRVRIEEISIGKKPTARPEKEEKAVEVKAEKKEAAPKKAEKAKTKPAPAQAEKPDKEKKKAPVKKAARTKPKTAAKPKPKAEKTESEKPAKPKAASKSKKTTKEK